MLCEAPLKDEGRRAQNLVSSTIHLHGGAFKREDLVSLDVLGRRIRVGISTRQYPSMPVLHRSGGLRQINDDLCSSLAI